MIRIRTTMMMMMTATDYQLRERQEPAWWQRIGCPGEEWRVEISLMRMFMMVCLT